jgi:hypoxanthine phosphoribosyltransferase
MQDVKKSLLLDSATIQARVKEIAAEIAARHSSGNLLFIGLLKGSFVFLADLVRAVNMPCEIDFARISSYGSGTESSGKLDIKLDIDAQVEGRNVILTDDIVDTGLTLAEYRSILASKGPESLEVAVLLDKPSRRKVAVPVDYCGFQIEDRFVVGYGLDWDERFRYLDGVYIIEES